MEVILRQDVTKLGKAGEVVKVKDGYGRNFLIPRGLAYQATEGTKRQVEAESRRHSQAAEKVRSEARELAARLEAVDLTFSVQAGEGDKLFGSVTSADIAERLAEMGHAIDKRLIELDEPIKLVGVHKVPVRLHADVRPELRVWVVKAE